MIITFQMLRIKIGPLVSQVMPSHIAKSWMSLLAKCVSISHCLLKPSEFGVLMHASKCAKNRVMETSETGACVCVRETHFRLGMRSAMPVMPAMMLLWEITTPLGMPVDPLVYMITAISDGTGCLRDTITAHRETHSHRFIRGCCVIPDRRALT